MENNIFIKSFGAVKQSFINYHTTGTLNSFNHPCIGYIKKGRAEFLYMGKRFFASEGDLIYIGSITKYYSVWYGSYRLRAGFRCRGGRRYEDLWIRRVRRH